MNIPCEAVLYGVVLYKATPYELTYVRLSCVGLSAGGYPNSNCQPWVSL